MEMRRLNDSGIKVFQQFLDSHSGDQPSPYPEFILSDVAYSDKLDSEVVVDRRDFETRFDLAEYLHSSFERAGFRPNRSDSGLWAWLACFYFSEICPLSRGRRQPGATPRWIPETADFRRYYRHLIAGPYGIYHAHRESPKRAMALLCQRPGRPGDLVEQLASRQSVVTNPVVMQVATEIYVDPATSRQLKSANRKGAGGARRFIDVLYQFDVTWDLFMTAPVDLRKFMGKEFSSA